MLTRSSVVEDPDRSDPPDVFCSLGSLIVEGRVPANVERGYGEGPHVPPSRNVPLARHECSDDNFMVSIVKIFKAFLKTSTKRQCSVTLHCETVVFDD
jgi:hypothetical protein